MRSSGCLTEIFRFLFSALIPFAKRDQMLSKRAGTHNSVTSAVCRRHEQPGQAALAQAMLRLQHLARLLLLCLAHLSPPGACDVAGGAGSVNSLPAAGNARLAPSFDASTPRNVTALVGKSAYLSCRVRNLGNRTVSWKF
ncbi:unnamed protein product [Leptosia nina]|uniref:Ig-like domain-containing protein n=1 Tax=Leptosia nina TaxID=320188 RepID=A0AAV1J4I6_9NEOP